MSEMGLGCVITSVVGPGPWGQIRLPQATSAPHHLGGLPLQRGGQGGVGRGIWSSVDDPAASNEGRKHEIPLTAGAIACLLVPRASEVSLANCIACHTSTPATTHGFPSTFRDWCGDCTTFPREMAEMALAHALDNETGQATGAAPR
jgi:hypothetical protein